MRDQTSEHDEQALLLAAQRGREDAVERLIIRHQAEVLRTAFLLTDSRAGAIRLAEEAVERAISELRKTDPERPARSWLIVVLATEFLASEPGGYRLPDAQPGDPGAHRFNVDTERSRLRATLALIDESARVAVVLRDFNHLPAEDVARAIRQNVAETDQLTERARERLRSAFDEREPKTVAMALNEAAVDAPRADLWPRVEATVGEILERERFRSRALTFGAIGVVLALLAGVGGLLVFGALAGDEGPEIRAAAAAPTAIPIPTALPMQVTTPTPAPTIEPEPAYMPPADVPDRLIRASELLDGRDRTIAHDPLTGVVTEIAMGPPAGISPDGSQIYFVDDRQDGDAIARNLVAVSTETSEVEWSAEVARLPVAEVEDAIFAFTTARGRVYVAMNDPEERPGRVLVAIFGQADGVKRGTWEFATQVEILPAAIDVFMYTVPDETAMIIVFRQREAGTAHVMRISLDVPDLIQRGTTPEPPGFPFADAIVTPDGQGLYVAPRSGTRDQAAVRFLDFEELSVTRVGLPFEPVQTGNGQAVLVETVPSHDGRSLYVISPYDRQVAVIDLVRRRLERVIPLEMPGIDVIPPGDLPLPSIEHAYRPGVAVISPDGRYLYAAGTAHLGDGAVATSVWKIDTTTWTVTAQWAPRNLAAIRSIDVSASGDVLYVYTAASGVERDSERRVGRLYIFDAETGTPILAPADTLPSFAVTGTLARMYLNTYGMSPSVDGVAPGVNHDYTSLPLAEISINPPFADPGSPVTITATFIDPASGELLSGLAPHVRYHASSTVTVGLANRMSEQIIILEKERYGVFSARATVGEPAVWDARLMVSAPDGTTWERKFDGAFSSQAIFPGTDGRLYVIESASPASQPVAGQPAEVVVQVVELETGKQIPPGVELRGGMPVELTLTLGPYSATDAGAATLFRSGHGVYSGFITFPEPGRQLPIVSYIARETLLFGTRVGPIDVRPAE